MTDSGNQDGEDVMIVDLADGEDRIVARLTVSAGEAVLEGRFPGGLTVSDLEKLGFVYYEMDPRGEMAARVQEVPLENSLQYLRALLDALPPGYHIAQVQSEKIRQERARKRACFEEELRLLERDEDG